jgi:hypothetical protein
MALYWKADELALALKSLSVVSRYKFVFTRLDNVYTGQTGFRMTFPHQL